MIIYKITNIINQKVYIGQTIGYIKHRLSSHFHFAKKDKSNNKLSNAIKKHGKENFKIEQIDSAETIDELNQKEIYWINFYNSRIKGYNIREGGHNSPCSEETKEKLRQINLGKKASEESRQKMREAAKSKPKRTKETCEKLRIANTGKVFTEERRQNISKANKGRILTEEWKAKIKASLNKTFTERKLRKQNV